MPTKSKKNSNFTSRFEEVVKYAGSAYKLSKSISISETAISKIRKGVTKPSFDMLIKILNKYPAIDINWLITGNGEMLKDDQETGIEISSPEKKGGSAFNQDKVKIELNYCQEMVKSKEKIIKLLEETVTMKDEKLKALISDNKKLKILLKNGQKNKDHAPRAE